MKRKLIAIDLDGTTLNNDSKISPLTKQTIKEVSELGHIITIITGRPYRNSFWFYDELELNTPIANLNGAFCHHPRHSHWQPAYNRRFSKDIALKLKKLAKYPVVELITAETLQTLYVDRTDFPPNNFVGHHVPKMELLEAENMEEDPVAINIFTKTEDFQPFIEDQVLSQFGDQVEVRTWGGQLPCLEIVQAGVQKAMAVEVIANDYQIDREDILAFGDEDNDYEMIQYAGLGVRMKNGIDGLLKVCDDTTEFTNDEDGLAHYLRKYFSLS